jgi:hypothetical protein
VTILDGRLRTSSNAELNSCPSYPIPRRTQARRPGSNVSPIRYVNGVPNGEQWRRQVSGVGKSICQGREQIGVAGRRGDPAGRVVTLRRQASRSECRPTPRWGDGRQRELACRRRERRRRCGWLACRWRRGPGEGLLGRGYGVARRTTTRSPHEGAGGRRLRMFGGLLCSPALLRR